jgi:beta-galactosidase/beta-glucuronidase
MPDPLSHRARATTDGKFFRLGERKYFAKGVTYGPFAPNSQGEPFASFERTVRDFQSLRGLGANLIRLYHVPPRWFLDLADKSNLQVPGRRGRTG